MNMLFFTPRQPIIKRMTKTYARQKKLLKLEMVIFGRYESKIFRLETIHLKFHKICQVNLPQQNAQTLTNAFADCSDLGLNETMTCQELLAFSVAFSAALPTSQTTLESFYTSLARNDNNPPEKLVQNTANYYEDFSCCYDLYQNAALNDTVDEKRSHSKVYRSIAVIWKVVNKVAGNFLRMFKHFSQLIILRLLYQL